MIGVSKPANSTNVPEPNSKVPVSKINTLSSPHVVNEGNPVGVMKSNSLEVRTQEESMLTNSQKKEISPAKPWYQLWGGSRRRKSRKRKSIRRKKRFV